MKYMIGRPIKGVSINGNEYLLDANNDILKFDTRNDCIKYIKNNVVDENATEDIISDFIWEEEDEG